MMEPLKYTFSRCSSALILFLFFHSLCLFNSSTSLFVVFAATPILHHSGKEQQQYQNNRRPNILLLITDDQDEILGGTKHMPILKESIIDKGVHFVNGFVHTPICCPSRSSILTGRYLHNGGALNNTLKGNCNGQQWQKGAEKLSIGVIAQQAGYVTSYAGKYLNDYGVKGSCFDDEHQRKQNDSYVDDCNRVPPGWDKWMGLVGNSVYYNYQTVSSDDNGKNPVREKHGDHYKDDYLPDLVANRTLDCLKQFTTPPISSTTDSSNEVLDKGKIEENKGGNKPFLMVAAWPSPHAPFTSAPQHEHELSKINVTKTPNYNASKIFNLQKHWVMRRLAPIDNDTAEWIENSYRSRLRTLLSVDEHIGKFIQLLEETGEIDNTIIMYTSDNGWQYGQHRLMADKRHLYEHDIRVPFHIRGPRIPEGKKLPQPVMNIDIAPTIYQIVNTGMGAANVASTPDYMDGQSFLPLLHAQYELNNIDGSHYNDHESRNNKNNKETKLLVPTTTIPWRNDFLVSYHGEGEPKCGIWTCPPPPPSEDHGGWEAGDAYNNTYHCVRSIGDSSPNKSEQITGGELSNNYIYCQFIDDENFVEYYDLDSNPWQLENQIDELSPQRRVEIANRLQQLRTCQGPTCRLQKTATSIITSKKEEMIVPPYVSSSSSFLRA